ncbi:hypothetical protein BRADI_1g67851v3 [Brachypodium distachyon]|uniref:Uncharacterized protein n=1 Tax=Brachypodium distachyon TaxID=15368 RepID=A0A0Q3HHY2_BRADI|nr:hypothetical protein BRADI_1g67851v3 [Brachypodium distachyon]
MKPPLAVQLVRCCNRALRAPRREPIRPHILATQPSRASRVPVRLPPRPLSLARPLFSCLAPLCLSPLLRCPCC